MNLPRNKRNPGLAFNLFNIFFFKFRVNYLNADVRIEDTITDAEASVYGPRVRHSKPCGYSGEYIITSPQFFSDDNQIMSSKYGDLGKWLIITTLPF